MNKLIVVLSALIMLSGCASSDPWTRQDTVMQSLVTASYIIDAHQTAQIQYHPELHEAGFAKHALGRQPSTSDTWQYFATVSISSYLIARALPEKWRPFFQGGQLAVQVPVIINNCALGLGNICQEDHNHEPYQ